jgi:hypothetical protein
MNIRIIDRTDRGYYGKTQHHSILSKDVAMSGEFFTLQDFMTFTKGITYILMVVSLCAITGFWLFLTERDSDQTTTDDHHHSK